SACRDRLMTHERAAEVQLAFDRQAGPALDLLRHDFGEQIRFGEVFRSHDDLLLSTAGEGRGRKQQGNQRLQRGRHTSFRSASPSNPSASSASKAAGSAPARINVSSTVATPRKM